MTSGVVASGFVFEVGAVGAKAFGASTARCDSEVDLINTAAVNYAIFLNGDADDIVKSGAAPPSGHKVCIEVFGASVAPALRDRIRRQFKSGIWNTYASNETNVIAVLDDDNVGTLERGMEVRLVDEQGGDVAPGRTGRIRVRGDTMVDCYFNAPELTRACFIDGWFQTNDLGCQPAPGKFLFLGRIDNVLNIGGVKVPATPIEERIIQLAHVSDAALLRIGNDAISGCCWWRSKPRPLTRRSLRRTSAPFWRRTGRPVRW